MLPASNCPIKRPGLSFPPIALQQRVDAIHASMAGIVLTAGAPRFYFDTGNWHCEYVGLVWVSESNIERALEAFIELFDPCVAFLRDCAARYTSTAAEKNAKHVGRACLEYLVTKWTYYCSSMDVKEATECRQAVLRALEAAGCDLTIVGWLCLSTSGITSVPQILLKCIVMAQVQELGYVETTRSHGPNRDITPHELAELSKKIGWPLDHNDTKSTGLLQEAFTHSSLDGQCHNRQLELLGDTILKLIVVRQVFLRWPFLDAMMEGVKHIISNDAAFQVAQKLLLGDHLRCGKSVKEPSKQMQCKLVEAVIAALWLSTLKRDGLATVVLQWYGDLSAFFASAHINDCADNTGVQDGTRVPGAAESGTRKRQREW